MMTDKLDPFTVFSVMSDPLIASEAHGPDAFYTNDTEETEAGWKNYISDQIERFQRGRYEEAGKALEKIMYEYVESAIDANPYLVAQQYEKEQIADHHTNEHIDGMGAAANTFFDHVAEMSYGAKAKKIKGEEK
jgi:hypothetical protein